MAQVTSAHSIIHSSGKAEVRADDVQLIIMAS